MKQYLLPNTGKFYKANMHVHTTVSDGGSTPEEVKAAYMEKGYSIVAFTDHEIMMPHPELADENFLPITSVEIATNEYDRAWPFTRTYHLNLYSKDPNCSCYNVRDNNRIWPGKVREIETEEQKQVHFPRFYEKMQETVEAATKAGFLVSYNHPVWSLQNYTDYIHLKGLWGVECYNTGCARNGYIDTAQPLDDLLRAGERVFPLATDDSHGLKDRFGGWIMVKAESLAYDKVMQALEKGDFYASTGAEIQELYIDGNELHISCAAAREVFVVTDHRTTCAKRAEWDGEPVTQAVFSLETWRKNHEQGNDGGQAYFRVVVINDDGSFAYSRAYFMDELQ